ncbi:MAG: hypothetical protein LC105_08955 [Chitinophagales bacterium]|nr:hypothetical protein [Chitinophagales bacterium]MCZ2393970.1 hypothetical protein [Chitinophagales bacterium]
MLKVILIALIGYFVLSRLFGRIVIIREVNRPSAPPPQKKESKEEISKVKPRKSGEDYIDYEEVK